MQPTSFPALPATEELTQIPRDLRFPPIVNLTPRILTPEQIRQFNQYGYLMPFPILTPTEIADLRVYFDTLLAQYTAEGKDSYSISTAHLRHGRVWDMLTHPRLVTLVTDLLGPSVIGWGSHFFCKMPGDGKVVSWHQDASYWPLTPARAVTVWLAIDDADRGNGCMRFLAGTHTLGHLTYQLSETDEANVLNQTVPDIDRYGEPVYVELPAGYASIHSDLLLHGSEANPGPRRRCGLTLRYTAGTVQAGLGWNEKGVVVAGEPVPHWSNRPRPECD
ncbi:MAG: phytanoyl-CoA dioxygenase family protein [Bacteroidales bacterium]|nr:phytanoyl-CoA dioxygenase family protein [Bacteroidales bacterium]